MSDGVAGLVSCVMPVFNGERWVAEAIESIRTQTYSPLEVIVVDDGSTDRTEAAVREAFSAFDAEIRTVYVRQENAGPSIARNTAIAHARGEYVALLDSDDRWRRDKTRRQLGALAEDAAVEVVLASARLFWESGLEKEAEAFDRASHTELTGLAGSTMLARRSVFDRVGLFDTQLVHAGFYDWFERATAAGIRWRAVPEALIERRMHPDNFSRTGAARTRDEMLTLLKRSLDRRRAGQQASVPPRDA